MTNFFTSSLINPLKTEGLWAWVRSNYWKFAKIWLKSKVLFYFNSFSFVSSCIHEIHIFCFSSKLLFRFPFHSVFYSVPFSVPFSVPHFSNTRKIIGFVDINVLVGCCAVFRSQTINIVTLRVGEYDVKKRIW